MTTLDTSGGTLRGDGQLRKVTSNGHMEYKRTAQTLMKVFFSLFSPIFPSYVIFQAFASKQTWTMPKQCARALTVQEEAITQRNLVTLPTMILNLNFYHDIKLPVWIFSISNHQLVS